MGFIITWKTGRLLLWYLMMIHGPQKSFLRAETGNSKCLLMMEAISLEKWVMRMRMAILIRVFQRFTWIQQVKYLELPILGLVLEMTSAPHGIFLICWRTVLMTGVHGLSTNSARGRGILITGSLSGFYTRRQRKGTTNPTTWNQSNTG